LKCVTSYDVTNSSCLTMSTIHLTLSTIHLTLCTVHLTVCTIHLTLCTINLTLCTIHLTLCTIHLTLATGAAEPRAPPRAQRVRPRPRSHVILGYGTPDIARHVI